MKRGSQKENCYFSIIVSNITTTAPHKSFLSWYWLVVGFIKGVNRFNLQHLISELIST
jgi:hypothetical protein